MSMQSGWLPVDGAEIYFERQGTGHLLVLIAGGPQDAGVFAELATCLSNRFTVIAFDPRGNSRTRVLGEIANLDVARHADDVAALIQNEGTTPAYVFGTSGGAQVGLDLAARYPDLVAKLVAHEPPAAMLLPDPDTVLKVDREIQDLFHREGPERAMAEFFAVNGLEDTSSPEASPAAADTMARIMGNFPYWLGYAMLPLTSFQPDVERLRSARVEVVVGLGEQSRGQPIENMTLALAAAIGVQTTSFPGDHIGYATQGSAFAEALAAALESGVTR